VLSFFVGKHRLEVVSRKCWKSYGRPKADGCSPFSITITRPGKNNFRGPNWPDNGGSGWPDNGGSALPTRGPNFERNFTRSKWPDFKHHFTGGNKPDMVVEGFACVCDTDLCNGKRVDESGGNGAQGSSPQNSQSPYFTIICILAMAALTSDNFVYNQR